METKRKVLAAAREEVIARGILGMRVANVAARAECSITSMYRYFGSRDGLLAEVLVGLYEESFEAMYSVIREQLVGTGPITIDDVLASIPLPQYERAKKDHAIRSQVFAVAGINPTLREKLAESLSTKRKMLMTLLDDIQTRLPAGVVLDQEVVTVLVFNINWQYNDLMREHAVSNEQYLSLLRRLLVKHS